MKHDIDVISRGRVYEGKVFSVDRERVKLPHGPTVWLDVVRHAQSVVILPVPEPGHIVLIRQYRHAVRQWLWEVPAGSVDEGESPEAAAARECHEEIGQVPDTVVRLGSLYPTPGYCDEEMVFFRVSGLADPAAAAAVDEDEDIEARTFTIREARDMVRRGEIVDMKTVVGLGML
ncbi:MAG TPA: NUDIX hydrolase [Vicinamibacterales bacterium]|nr:NUDIX hydrolase [Vicinamibacterales bacterium]